MVRLRSHSSECMTQMGVLLPAKRHLPPKRETFPILLSPSKYQLHCRTCLLSFSLQCLQLVFLCFSQSFWLVFGRFSPVRAYLAIAKTAIDFYLPNFVLFLYLWIPFVRLRKDPRIPRFLRAFIMNRYSIFSHDSSSFIEIIIKCFSLVLKCSEFH